VQYVRAVDFGAFPDGKFHSQRLADASTGLDSCICLCTRVPPGTGTTSGLHTHPSDQLYYVLSGTMHARVGEQMYVVGPDSLVIIPAGVPHWNWNEGAEDEVHFELIVPPPPPGQPLVTRVDADAAPVAIQLDPIRVLDHARFQEDSFSQVILADRSSGLETLSLGVFRVPPGNKGTALHMHRFDQIYYIMRGTMELELGFEHYSVGPNMLVTIPAGMPHRNWNATTEPEYHLNLRVPEPIGDIIWDVPVTLGSEEARLPT
jgi:mannose-6-phosphate isomerase-like protein (cupin superfamily)